MENAQKYYGLTFTDLYHKTITLTPEGIVISKTKGLLGHKFQKTIPYSSVLDVYNYPARMTSFGFFSILTSVGGMISTTIDPTTKQINEIVQDENTIAYKKKHMALICRIIDAIKELKENISLFSDDSVGIFKEYWGMSFKDFFGKKIELASDGIHLSKKTFSKVIHYSNIFEVYVEYPKKMENGILSIVENTGLTALKKLELLQTTKNSRFMNDENSIYFIKSQSNEIEKIYYAIKVIQNAPMGVSYSNKLAVNDEQYISSDNIDEMDGHEFEYFCADILRKNGFNDVIVTKGSGDQGVDILATKDCIKYAVQCKNYSSPLGNTPVQEVNAGKTFYGCHVGVVMTNSSFTSGAKDLAQATGVLLWDRSVLQEMNSKH